MRDWPVNPTERDVYCGPQLDHLGFKEFPRTYLGPEDFNSINLHKPSYPNIDYSEQHRLKFERILWLARCGNVCLYAPKICHCYLIKTELEARL